MKKVSKTTHLESVHVLGFIVTSNRWLPVLHNSLFRKRHTFVAFGTCPRSHILINPLYVKLGHCMFLSRKMNSKSSIDGFSISSIALTRCSSPIPDANQHTSCMWWNNFLREFVSQTVFSTSPGSFAVPLHSSIFFCAYTARASNRKCSL